MPHDAPPGGTKPSWAYAYQIVPPQPADRLRAIRTLLAKERERATSGERTWEGRLVMEQQATHILVVSDSPEQSLEANKRLEAALAGLEVGFALTAPMAVSDDPDPPEKSTGRRPPKP